jgi:hypothetical protein
MEKGKKGAGFNGLGSDGLFERGFERCGERIGVFDLGHGWFYFIGKGLC